MEVSVKQERLPEPLGVFVSVPETILNGCALEHHEIDERELLDLRRAIETRNRQWMEPPDKRTERLRVNETRRRRHANETEEQRKARLARDAQRRREARLQETEEESRARKAKEAAARRHSRQYKRQYLETEAEALIRRRKNAASKRLQRQLMSPEQRAEMRKKGAARQAEKRRRQQELKMNSDKVLGQDVIGGQFEAKDSHGGGTGTGTPKALAPESVALRLANSVHHGNFQGLSNGIIIPSHLVSGTGGGGIDMKDFNINSGLPPAQFQLHPHQKTYPNPYNYHC